MRKYSKYILALTVTLLSLCAIGATPKNAMPEAKVISFTAHYHLNQNQTYTADIKDQYQLLSAEGVEDNKQYSIAFFPNSQKITELHAIVLQPNRQTIIVPKENMRDQPTFASTSAANLTDQHLISITFPQLTVGSTITVSYRLTQTTPPQLGFFYVDQPNFYLPAKKRTIIITYPKSLPLQAKQIGGYKITKHDTGKETTLTATLSDQPRHFPQPHMVSPSDILPVFSASTFPSWQALGNHFWQDIKDKIVVNKEITTLAKTIVGKKTGLPAAQAIYNWVEQHIYYVAVRLNQSDNYTPPSSIETLHNRYGDCKAIVVLMQALYKAVGIKSQLVLIEWSNAYRVLPTPNPAQFNHAILYLPTYHLYLNSTDRFASFGVLERGLQDKFVIHVDANSSVSKTAAGNPKDNQYTANSIVTLDKKGSLSGKLTMDFTGVSDAIWRRTIAKTLGIFDTKEFIDERLKNTQYSGFGTLQVSNLQALDHPLSLAVTWHSPQAIMMQKHIFLLLPEGPQVYEVKDLRQYLFEHSIRYPIIATPGQYTWHEVVTIPSDYQLQILPASINVQNSAGQYHVTYKKLSPPQFSVTKQLTILKNVYTPKDYTKLKKLAVTATSDANSVFYFLHTHNIR